MSFWTETSDIKDPKRKFRFIVQFTNITDETGYAWWAKTVSKPSFQISAAEHKYLNHTFFYPGSVTWQDVSMTLVDPQDPDMSSTLSAIIAESGYAIPTGVSTAADLATISKGQAVEALGAVNIIQLDGEGAQLETWTLNNAWISEVKYGDLEYGSDDLLELSITMKYDWATVAGGGASVLKADTSSTFFSTE